MTTVMKLGILIFVAVIAAVRPTPLSIPLIQKIHTGHDLVKFWAKQARLSDVDKRDSKMLQYIYRSRCNRCKSH